MEEIKVGDQKYRVAVYISPTTESNEVKWVSSVRSSPDFQRIAHVDIVRLRRAYDRCGYLGELLLVLQSKYSSEYPCASFIRNHGFEGDAIKEFIDRVNASDITKILMKH